MTGLGATRTRGSKSTAGRTNRQPWSEQMENWDGLNESDDQPKPANNASEIWDFPKTDPVEANSLVNEFIRACPAPGRDVEIELFCAQIAKMLVMCPPEVSRAVMHPLTGLAVKVEFFPTPFAVKAAIDKEMAPYYRLWERRK